MRGMTRLEQEWRKKWLLDYILYEESEDEEARQVAFENMSNMSYDEFREWAVQKGYIKEVKKEKKNNGKSKIEGVFNNDRV